MERAVIAIVKGGLGNQLFIYATARALALRTGRALYLDARRGFTSDEYGRSYRLNHFPIQAAEMPEAWRIAPTLQHPRHKIIRALNKLLPRTRRSYYAELRRGGPEQLTRLNPRRERITLLGYWQNEGYFADHAAPLRVELTPPRPTDETNLRLGARYASEESVFVHFRRVRYWNLLGRDYYQRAIDTACAELFEPRFVLFGDDLDWPRQHLDFRGRPVEASTHNGANEPADLWLMTQCRHAIVANSSFSWWGAWLADGSVKRLVLAPQETGWPVIMPKRWQRIANRITTGN